MNNHNKTQVDIREAIVMAYMTGDIDRGRELEARYLAEKRGKRIAVETAQPDEHAYRRFLLGIPQVYPFDGGLEEVTGRE